jgi:hypothetical protein
MSELYVMRRANGDLFREEVGGKLTIPVWSSMETVARYRERNPELMLFLPERLDRSLMKKIMSNLGTEATEFFLLSENAPDAYLSDGRPITLEELFPEEQVTSEPAHLQT